jgi:LysM domain
MCSNSPLTNERMFVYFCFMTNERSKSRTWSSAPSAFGTSTCRTRAASEFSWSGARANAPAQRTTARLPQGRGASRSGGPAPAHRPVHRRVVREVGRAARHSHPERTPLRVLVLAGLLALAALIARTGSADALPSTSPRAVHVVAPGDTLWSIARDVSPHGSIGPVIARLVRDNGLSTASAVLRPGDALLLPNR